MQDSYPTYRLTDPTTSQQPVHDKPRLKAAALAAIARHPGITAGGLGDVTRIDGIWKRLPELERDGLIVRGAPTWYPGTGRYQTTWHLAERQMELEMEVSHGNGNSAAPTH
jgi:hypothetical protein